MFDLLTSPEAEGVPGGYVEGPPTAAEVARIAAINAWHDEYDELEAEVRTLAGEINAAHARLATKVATMTSDPRYNLAGDWRSVTHWLIVNCGMTRYMAQLVAQVAESVTDNAMPTVMGLAHDGAISLGMAALAARVACPENEQALAGIATTATTTQAARAFGWYRKLKPGIDDQTPDDQEPTDDETPDDERASGDERPAGSAQGGTAVPTPDTPDVTDDDETYWRTWTDEHGRWRVNGRAPVELGALLDEAFEAARRSAQRHGTTKTHNNTDSDSTHNTAAGDQPASEDPRDSRAPAGERTAIASNYLILYHLARMVIDSAQTDRLTREGNEPFCVNVLVDIDTLVTQRLRPDSVATLLNGTELTPTVVAMLAQAGTLQLLWHQNGVPIKVGTEQRFATPTQRKALRVQYGGCAVPGCGQTRFLHYHHVQPYPHGPTDLDNLVPICSFHHRRIHSGHLNAAIVDGQAQFHDERGRLLGNTMAQHALNATTPPTEHSLRNRIDNIDIDKYTAKPAGAGAPLTSWALSVWVEALLGQP